MWDDHINSNHFVTTLTNAPQEIAGKIFLYTPLFPSISFFGLQRSDQQSVEMLAFNFA